MMSDMGTFRIAVEVENPARVEPTTKQLVDAGPAPAALATL
jgi:hypothetical protein